MTRGVRTGSISPREIVRDFMSAQFKESGKVEWKIGELETALAKTETPLDRKQISNALLALRQARKAEQTSQIPDSTKPARYWALTACMEAATSPEKPEPEKPSKLEKALQEEHEIMTENNDRKPRHDSPEHMQHMLEKQFKEMSDTLTKELLVGFGDMAKSLKGSFVDAVGAIADNAGKAVLDMNPVEEKLQEFLQQWMGESTALTKLGMETASSFAEKHAQTMHAIAKMIEQTASQEDVKEAGYSRGFTAGWMAATQQAKREILQVAEIANEENKKDPARNAAGIKFEELLQRLGGEI